MALVKFNQKTPEEKLEEASRLSEATIIYQCRTTGNCYESDTAYIWAQIKLHANRTAATRDKQLKT